MAQDIKWSPAKEFDGNKLPWSKKRGQRHLDQMSAGVIQPRYSDIAAQSIPQSVDLEAEPIDDDDHGTGTARGILLALAISAAMWGALWLAADLLFAW